MARHCDTLTLQVAQRTPVPADEYVFGLTCNHLHALGTNEYYRIDEQPSSSVTDSSTSSSSSQTDKPTTRSPLSLALPLSPGPTPTPTPTGPPRTPRHSSASSLPSLSSSLPALSSLASLSKDIRISSNSPRALSPRQTTPRSASSPRLYHSATVSHDSPPPPSTASAPHSDLTKNIKSLSVKLGDFGSDGNVDLSLGNSEALSSSSSLFQNVQLPAPPTPTGNAGSHPFPQLHPLPSPPLPPSTPNKSNPSSPAFPSTSSSSSSSQSSSSSVSTSTNSFSSPSVLHSRPTRTRTRNGKANTEEKAEDVNKTGKALSRGYFHWVQASAYMALGGLLFCVVETVLKQYYFS